jgi:hypothetical protein
MRILAYSLSVLLHPILIPVLTILILVEVDPLLSELLASKALWQVLLAVAITTAILPALSVYILYKAELIESMELKTRRERILPFTMTLFYLIATYVLLLDAPLPTMIYSAMLGGIVAFAGLTIMTWFWRISAHLCAYASLVGALSGLYSHSPFPFQDLLVMLILLGGALASARLYLEAHSLTELAMGAAWGFCASFFFVSRNIYVSESFLFA